MAVATMSVFGWIVIGVGIWFGTGAVLALCLGPPLRRQAARYPLPADEQDPEQPSG